MVGNTKHFLLGFVSWDVDFPYSSASKNYRMWHSRGEYALCASLALLTIYVPINMLV